MLRPPGRSISLYAGSALSLLSWLLFSPLAPDIHWLAVIIRGQAFMAGGLSGLSCKTGGLWRRCNRFFKAKNTLKTCLSVWFSGCFL